MMNYKRLSQKDWSTLLKIADETGPVDMLRCIGQIIATQHPDLDKGNELRWRLRAIANELNETQVETGKPNQ